MKRILATILIFLFIFSISFADSKIKPNRLNNDPKILGLIAIKDPYKIYQKIAEIFENATPGIMNEIIGEVSIYIPILEKASNIVFVYYHLNDEISIGYYITVKDKKIFDNILIASFENKEVIENTMIISEEDDELKIFKDLYPKISALNQKKEVEVNVDLKNIFFIFEEDFKKEKNKSIKQFCDQFDMLTLNLNFTKEPYDQELSLLPTENSNLQKMLNQTGIDKLTLLDLIGTGNIMSSYSQFDFIKATPFILDTLKAIQTEIVDDDDSKKDFKEVEKNIHTLFSKLGLVQMASNFSFDKKTIFSEVIKCQNPKENLKDFFTVFNHESSSNLKEFISLAYEFIQDEFLDAELNYQFEKSEKIGDLEVYKLSSKAEDDEQSILDFEHFLTANDNYILLRDSIPALKELIEKVNVPATKSTVTLESFTHFKAGLSNYTDINIMGFFKFIDNFERGLGGNGLNLANLLNEKLKPIKIAQKMDGNYTLLINIDLSIVKVLAKIILPNFMDIEEMENMDKDPKDEPNAKP